MTGEFQGDQLGALRAINQSFTADSRDEGLLIEQAKLLGPTVVKTCLRHLSGPNRDVTWATRLVLEVAKSHRQHVDNALEKYIQARGANYESVRALKYTLEAKLHGAGVYREAKRALEDSAQAAALCAQLKWSNDSEVLSFLDEFSFYHREAAMGLTTILQAELKDRLSSELTIRLEAWDRVLNGTPKQVGNALLELGKELLSEGDFDAALQLSRLYVDDNPFDGYGHFFRANCFELVDDLAMAHRHFSLAHRLKPSIGEWTWRAATSAQKLGKNGAAFRHFTTYLMTSDDALEASFRRSVATGFTQEYAEIANLEFPGKEPTLIAFIEDLSFEALQLQKQGNSQIPNTYLSVANRYLPNRGASPSESAKPLPSRPRRAEILQFSAAPASVRKRRRRQTVNG